VSDRGRVSAPTVEPALRRARARGEGFVGIRRLDDTLFLRYPRTSLLRPAGSPACRPVPRPRAPRFARAASTGVERIFQLPSRVTGFPYYGRGAIARRGAREYRHRAQRDSRGGPRSSPSPCCGSERCCCHKLRREQRASRRAVRERGPLPQPDRARLRLLLEKQDAQHPASFDSGGGPHSMTGSGARRWQVPLGLPVHQHDDAGWAAHPGAEVAQAFSRTSSCAALDESGARSG